MRIIVDLSRCESYAQCCFFAPTVFWLHGRESLEFDYAPSDDLRTRVMRAAAACPVQAIGIVEADDRGRGRRRREEPA